MSATATSASWCSVENVAAAADRCGRRKGGPLDAIAFRLRQGEEVLALSRRLASGTYNPQPGRVFVTERPKHREVHAAAYRDRVVHHLIHALVEPIFEPAFSDASFACRTGKGTHAAAARLHQHMSNLSRQGGVRVWALSMDVVNFFMSLHKPTLLELLEPRVRGLEARLGAEGRLPESGFGPWELCRRIVSHDPAQGARRLGPARTFASVPPQKHLGALGPERGIPIGNLTSQFFANVYLSPLDHFVQRTLGVRGYVRYVDDFVLLDVDRDRLESYEARIRAFLHDRLKLDVRTRPLTPASEGVDFVGYIVRPTYLLPRRRVVKALREKLLEAEEQMRPVAVPGGERLRLPRLAAIRGPVRAWRLDEGATERLRATWASYDGHLTHARSFRLREGLWQAHPVASHFLAKKRGRITRRFALIRPAISFRAQLARLALGIGMKEDNRRFFLLVQVGRFVEVAAHGWRLGLRQRRVGRRWTAGAPWPATARLIQRGLSQGYAVAVALEDPEPCGNVKRRRLAYLFEPPGASGKERVS
jgi:RNA-directed DNA polymerase